MTSDKESPYSQEWAKSQLEDFRIAAMSNCNNIYTMGFVASPQLSEKENDLKLTFRILIAMLTLVSLAIQTVVPITVIVNLESPDGLCPNQVEPLGKIVGVVLCLFFVFLTITICLSKLRGLGFLKLFCTQEIKLLGCNRFFLDLALLSNMCAMVVCGIAQYLLFIRNANKDYLLLLLQSLAMQFVLTPDVRLMTGPWAAWTKGRLETLMKHENDKILARNEDSEAAVEDEKDSLNIIVRDQDILKKVKFLYVSEAIFLVMVSAVGLAWTITLGYCM